MTDIGKDFDPNQIPIEQLILEGLKALRSGDLEGYVICSAAMEKRIDEQKEEIERKKQEIDKQKEEIERKKQKIAELKFQMGLD